MRIALISDMHLEYNNTLDSCLHAGTDVIVVAGDLGVGAHNTAEALILLSKHYSDVIYVPGNHEYYGTSLPEFDQELTQRLLAYPNIHFLNNKFRKIKGITFIGSPFWTNFRYDPLAIMAAKVMISDFRLIKNFTPEDSVKLHYKAHSFIQWAYENCPGPKVIVTHFLPATECIHEKFKNENLINNYFSNNYGEWISELENTTWLFGHTHEKIDLTLGLTRLVANPHGYDAHPYKPLIIDVDRRLSN